MRYFCMLCHKCDFIEKNADDTHSTPYKALFHNNIANIVKIILTATARLYYFIKVYEYYYSGKLETNGKSAL